MTSAIEVNVFTSPASQALPGQPPARSRDGSGEGESLFGSRAAPQKARLPSSCAWARKMPCSRAGFTGVCPLQALRGVNAWLLLFSNSYFKQETLHFQFALGPASDVACWLEVPQLLGA